MSKGHAQTFLFPGLCIRFVAPGLDVLVGGAAFVVLTGICQSQRFNRAIMLLPPQSDSGLSITPAGAPPPPATLLITSSVQGRLSAPDQDAPGRDGAVSEYRSALDPINLKSESTTSIYSSGARADGRWIDARPGGTRSGISSKSDSSEDTSSGMWSPRSSWGAAKCADPSKLIQRLISVWRVVRRTLRASNVVIRRGR